MYSQHTLVPLQLSFYMFTKLEQMTTNLVCVYSARTNDPFHKTAFLKTYINVQKHKLNDPQQTNLNVSETRKCM